MYANRAKMMTFEVRYRIRMLVRRFLSSQSRRFESCIDPRMIAMFVIIEVIFATVYGFDRV